MADETCFGAIIENRAKEIGLAIFLKDEARLLLSQFIETSRYIPNLLPKGVPLPAFPLLAML